MLITLCSSNSICKFVLYFLFAVIYYLFFSGDELNPDAPSISKEEEVKEMTLDEYKTIMEKEKPQAAFNVRKANEGERNPLKNAVAMKKQTEEEQEADGSLFFPKRVSSACCVYTSHSQALLLFMYVVFI